MEYELFARGDERRRKAAAAALNPILVSSRDRAKKDRPPAPVAPPSSCDAFHQPARPPPAAAGACARLCPSFFIHPPRPLPSPLFRAGGAAQSWHLSACQGRARRVSRDAKPLVRFAFLRSDFEPDCAAARPPARPE